MQSCDQDVFWATTLKGRPMLLNMERNDEEGNVRVVGRSAVLNALVVEVLPKSEVGAMTIGGEERYVTHFATCPASKEWSGRSR